MAQNKVDKVALSECRIRKLLSVNQGIKVTSGSGCIVTLNMKCEASTKPCVYLITTTQVITKNDLLSGTSIVVEFLDGGNGKSSTFDLGSECATEIPDPIPGRVLGGTGDALKEVSFITIPVQKLNLNRNVIKRAYSSVRAYFRGTSFEKRSLHCSHESDETLQLAISSRQILCHVMCDGRSSGSYSTEPYCLEFGKDTTEFALTSPLDHDGAGDVKQLKDFHKEEKPRGAPLLNAEGKFVGMLAVASSEERKLFPLFLSTLEQDSSTPHTGSKDDLNTPVSDCVVVSSEIAVQPETSMTAASGSDQAGENGSTRQEERNKSSTNNNQNCTHQSPYAENNYCSTSGVQGSGIPVANPLQLENSLQEPAPDELFPEEDPLPCPPPTSQLPA